MLPGDVMTHSHLGPVIPDRARGFVDHVLRRAVRRGVSVKFSADARVPYMGDPCMLVSGYFIDRPVRELAVAQGKPTDQWLGVLVHESCHMDQWIQEAPCWQDAFMPDGREALDWLNDWVARRLELPQDQVLDIVRRCRELELDCERRAVMRIQQYDLPLSIEDYIRKANAYVFFYDFIATSRKWYPDDTAPYEQEEVISHAPGFFTRNEDALQALRQAYDRVYARPENSL